MPLASTTTVAKALAIALALVGWAGAQAAEQQASFTVAITLHSISKPLAVAQLCPAGKALDRVGVAITVTCPEPAGQVNRYATGNRVAQDPDLNATSSAASVQAFVVISF